MRIKKGKLSAIDVTIKSNVDLDFFAFSSLLPMRINETGDDTTPTTEAIICDNLAGEANYESNMPATLSLVRRLADGTEYRARYEQEIE